MTLSVDALQSLWAMTPVPAAGSLDAAQNARDDQQRRHWEQQHHQRRAENITLNLNDVTTGNQTLTITQDNTSKAQTQRLKTGWSLD